MASLTNISEVERKKYTNALRIVADIATTSAFFRYEAEDVNEDVNLLPATNPNLDLSRIAEHVETFPPNFSINNQH